MGFYVHGVGRSGLDAWPCQAGIAGAIFADHAAEPVMAGKVDTVVHQAPSTPGVVVAHSLGAVVWALAVRRGLLPTTHAVLVEPALYDVARGDAAVERHVGPMTEARRLAVAGDVWGFWRIFSPLMFGQPADPDRWENDQPTAQRFAALEAPWGHGVTADVVRDVPTLVVTGAWNDEYETIAGRLEAAGAKHMQLPGHRHRPQDHPDFNGLVVDFASGA